MKHSFQWTVLVAGLLAGLSTAVSAKEKFELQPADFQESLAVNKQLALLMAEQVVCEYEQPKADDLWVRALAFSRVAPALVLDKFDSVPREFYENPFANALHLKLSDAVDAQSKQIGAQAYAMFSGKCNESSFLSKAKQVESQLREKTVDKRIDKLNRMNVAPAF